MDGTPVHHKAPCTLAVTHSFISTPIPLTALNRKHWSCETSMLKTTVPGVTFGFLQNSRAHLWCLHGPSNAHKNADLAEFEFDG